jgi:hypothetical protein
MCIRLLKQSVTINKFLFQLRQLLPHLVQNVLKIRLQRQLETVEKQSICFKQALWTCEMD